MPAVRGSRASKACDSCRARKTRCYESGSPTNACLRCSTLQLKCSQERRTPRNLQSSPGLENQHSCSLVDERITALEATVKTLVDIVSPQDRNLSHVSHQRTSGTALLGSNKVSDEEQNHTAPLTVIRDAALEDPTGLNGHDEYASSDQNIILKGLLSHHEVELLLDAFQAHYGRWIGIDERGSERLSLENVKSPLLLCACCLIAVRHRDLDRTPDVAASLFREANALLGTSLLHAPQSLEFFQAILILSLWPTTVGESPMIMDSWLITGFAIQHALASDAFKSQSAELAGGYLSVRNLSIWNHVCLSHLHACIMTRRRTALGPRDLEQARRILLFEHLTNFEERMVAEFHLYWIIYEHCIPGAVSISKANAALKTWKSEWAFLFDQPRPHLLQTSFLFAQLIMYEQSLSHRSAAVRESMVSEMVRLSSEILVLFKETRDERTKYLTDHIYHVITFAAITLCRLVCRYEDQLRARHDIDDMDALVSTTVHSLREIGLPSHIASKMGNVVSTVQRKLRPASVFSPRTGFGVQSVDFEPLLIPELFGMDNLDFDWDAILPDWSSPSFASDGN